MKETQLPTAVLLRKQLAEKKTDFSALGRAYTQAGRWHEACECLGLAGDQNGLTDLLEAATQAGDFFVWRQVLRALNRQPQETEIQMLRDKACAAGKLCFAQAAESLLSPKDNDATHP